MSTVQSHSPQPKPVVLAILDGWGLAKPSPGNAISLASTPNMTKWQREYPYCHLEASGQAVGLPEGIVGNSEVGHLNLGAGYVVAQDAVRINKAIDRGSFFSNTALVAACSRAKRGKHNLHLLILAETSQVHSNLDHLWAMLKLAQQQEVPNVYVHLFSDGRDSAPTWLGKNSEAIQHKIELGGGKLVSLIGRYYAMDRNRRWERTEKAYRLLTERKGGVAVDLAAAVNHSYASKTTDEFIGPTIIANGKAIEAGDEVIFLNFRTDRPRQLSEALVGSSFQSFERKLSPTAIQLTTMTEYEPSIPVAGVAFAPEEVTHPLARVLSEAGLKQLHAAETEKYAHVTYFFNGGQEEAFIGEDRLLVPSPKVATYDLKPQMSASELTNQVCTRIDGDQYDAIIINYANADMVAHTGNLKATIKAVETIDECLGQLWQQISKQRGILFISADHGNAEIVQHPDGSVDTEHNPSLVPLMVIGEHLPGHLVNGSLSNVAPTMLQVMDIQPPAEMTAKSLWEGK